MKTVMVGGRSEDGVHGSKGNWYMPLVVVGISVLVLLFLMTKLKLNGFAALLLVAVASHWSRGSRWRRSRTSSRRASEGRSATR